MIRFEKLKNERDCAFEDISGHWIGDCELSTAEMRTRAQAILDWANHTMNETLPKELAAAVDPFGQPVDRRGME